MGLLGSQGPVSGCIPHGTPWRWHVGISLLVLTCGMQIRKCGAKNGVLKDISQPPFGGHSSIFTHMLAPKMLPLLQGLGFSFATHWTMLIKSASLRLSSAPPHKKTKTV